MLKTLKDIDVKGKKVLFRVAYDITLQKKDGQMVVPDDTRIRATLPTLNYLLEQGCSIGLLSWLKRPAGKVVPEMRMKPIAETLAGLLGRPVKALDDCVGAAVENEIRNMKAGDIIMLENVRFHPEEEEADQDFARQLVKGFDLIVFDAFAQAMRLHASTTGILQELPAVTGFLFVKEIEYLSKLLENPARPFVALLGGAKVSDRVELLKRLIHKADHILIGGALANTFFLARDIPVGKSLVEDVYVDKALGEKQDWVEICRKLLIEGGAKIQLPLDMVAAAASDSEATLVVNLDRGEEIPAEWSFYDIGPRTIASYQKVLSQAKLIFGNGPMGLFEKENFARGTKAVAEAMIASAATTVIGGGDTESIVQRYGWEGKFSHVSTGGGASLNFLAGKQFPVMKYLIKD